MNTAHNIMIERIVTPIGELALSHIGDVNGSRVNESVRIVDPDGRLLRPTKGFWNSLSARFDLDRSMIAHLHLPDVFDKISQQDVEVELVVDISGEEAIALSCISPKKPIIEPEHIKAITDKFGHRGVWYQDGIAEVVLDVQFGDDLRIVGETLRPRISLELPLNGCGFPAIYLAVGHPIDKQTIVARNKKFKATIRLGGTRDGVMSVLDGHISTFNNEEGYGKLKSRLRVANISWASYLESSSLFRTISGAMKNEALSESDKAKVLDGFDDMCGDPLRWYGVTSRTELSSKKARNIPVKTFAYDLLRFASGVSTHHLKNRTNRLLVNNWIGRILATDYDLENSAAAFPKYEDFFTQAQS